MFQSMILDLVREGLNKGVRVNDMTDAVERQYIVDVLISCGFNQCRAAAVLGWHRNTLNRKLIQFRIKIKELRAQVSERKPATSQGVKPQHVRFA